MKISVCGKGGSGKSVIVTLLANAFRDRGYHVLVVDSDESNSGLYRMLGFTQPPLPLMEMLGGKKGLKDKMAVKFSSGEAEVKMEVLAQDKIRVKDLPPQYVAQRDRLKLVNIGKILHSLEGCACPMGVLSREFLKKLYLEEDEVVIVDTEAGVEHFGRGVETSVDRVLVVVEPSFESLGIALKIKELAADAGVEKTWAILNKINSDEIAIRFKGELAKRDMQVIGIVHHIPQIFKACMGGHKLGVRAVPNSLRKVVDILTSKV